MAAIPSHAVAAQAAQVWTATNGLAGGFRDATGDPETNAMTYQTGQTYQYTRPDSAASYTGIVADAFSPAGPVMTYASKPGFPPWTRRARRPPPATP